MLNTKSILAPKEDNDGWRISIMSRHTLNDGITPHPNITEKNYNEWLKILSPPAILLGEYYKRGLLWEQFELRYLEYIRGSNVRNKVEKLAERSLYSIVTILCVEERPDQCHRRILAEECKRYQPSLILNIE